MKNALLSFLVAAFALSVQSQTMYINNASACDIQFYVSATDANCANNAYSINYVIPAGGTMNLTFGSTTWNGAVPGIGWQWSYIKAGNFCGPYNWTNVTCPNPGAANDNVVVLGIPCQGFGFTQCANMTTTCNNPSCNWIRCSWAPLTGGDVQVGIG